MEKEFGKEMNEDFDDGGELDVEWYPIPKGLEEAWDELTKEEDIK